MAMSEEQKNTKTVQNIILENRRKIAISGVLDVDSFDEHSIILLTDLGILEVNGADIKIEKLNLENGEISASGEFDNIEYVTDRIEKGGVLKKIFR